MDHHNLVPQPVHHKSSSRMTGADGTTGTNGTVSPFRVEEDAPMDNKTSQVSAMLRQAAETHHQVFAITDGDDPDWATWYADWLVNLSPLSELVGTKPVRSELTYLLVKLDKEYRRTTPTEAWEDFYAVRLMEHLSTTSH